MIVYKQLGIYSFLPLTKKSLSILKAILSKQLGNQYFTRASTRINKWQAVVGKGHQRRKQEQSLPLICVFHTWTTFWVLHLPFPIAHGKCRCQQQTGTLIWYYLGQSRTFQNLLFSPVPWFLLHESVKVSCLHVSWFLRRVETFQYSVVHCWSQQVVSILSN